MTSDLDLGPLRTFLAAYRNGSMTRTAHELGLSQPGVTAQVKKLERQLGARLFQRTSRGLVPTTAAEELATRIAPHLDGLRAALDGLARTRTPTGDPYARTVLLGGPAEVIERRVLPALGDLCAHGLRLRVTTGLTDDLLAELGAGALDLVVATTRPRVRGLTAVPVADEEFVLVAAPSLAGRVDLPLLPSAPRTALSGVPVVAYAEDLPIVRRYWRHVFGQAPPGGTPAVLVGDLRAVASATAAGAGWSVLPRYLVRARLDDGSLVVLHEPDDPPINTFHLAWRTTAVGHPAVSAVRSRLVEDALGW